MKSPVLFVIFKREDTTRRVFERIREAQPPRLYIAADGPRMDRPDEIEKCKATRKVVENVDWPCEVFHLYREKNLGCGRGVSGAISWFFEHEEQGIVLEDDILPHSDFFLYCDEMLEKYKNDERIQLVWGHNAFYQKYHSSYSYYMTNFIGIWGWASWRRVWKTYEYDVNKIDLAIFEKKLSLRVPPKTCKFFVDILKKMRRRNLDTWDYQFYFNQILNDRYTICCYTNMTQNIGFDTNDASHTCGDNDNEKEHFPQSPFPLIHPTELFVDPIAEEIRIKNSSFLYRGRTKKLVDRMVGIVRNLYCLVF